MDSKMGCKMWINKLFISVCATKVCVTLLDTENLKQFFKIYHLHVGLSKFNHQDATPMLVNMIIIFTRFLQ